MRHIATCSVGFHVSFPDTKVLLNTLKPYTLSLVCSFGIAEIFSTLLSMYSISLIVVKINIYIA